MTRGSSILVEELAGPPVARRRIEVVERKGIGHPDTICDSLVEAIALALNRMYLERLGVVAHYNIDKALLVAGQCRKTFGGGEVIRPMELIVGDRATFEADGHKLPVEETAHAAVDTWLADHLPRVAPHVRTRIVLAPGSAELTGIFAPRATEIVSNDTSGASGYAPLSATEEIVMAVEGFLNGSPLQGRLPGHRPRREGVRLARGRAAASHRGHAAPGRPYFVRASLLPAQGRDPGRARASSFRRRAWRSHWRLNNLDVAGRGSDGVYLTLTGTSAEDADSGQVGRGNRANGLIAFARPNGGEATAGKNALAHAGKVYSVLSHRLARRIHTAVAGLAEVYVHLAARIGEPIDRPWVGVQVVLDRGVALANVEATIRQTVQAETEHLADFRIRLSRGEFPVC